MVDYVVEIYVERGDERGWELYNPTRYHSIRSVRAAARGVYRAHRRPVRAIGPGGRTVWKWTQYRSNLRGE